MQNPSQELKSKKAQKMFYGLFFKQSQVTPLVFFSFVLIKQFELISSQYSSYSLFYVGIVFFIFSCFNHFLLYSSVLTASIGGLAPYNIAIGLIGSNQKWKLYLFWFVATYYFTYSYANIVQIFIIVNSGYICIQTFREFIFVTVGDNVAYFTGFFTLLFIHLFSFVVQATQTYKFNSIEKACIIPILTLLGYSIINLKIHNIKQCEPTTIKNPSIFIQYINMIRKSVQNEQNIHSYLYIHKQSCIRNHCFCKQVTDAKLLSITSTQIQRLSQQIINSVFIQYFESHNFDHEDRLILFHKYIQYLIQCRQYPRALIILTQINEQSMSYFNRAQNYRIRAKLQDYLRKFQYFDRNREKLKHIYQYDLEVGYVLKELREIMQDKVQFWKQLCRQTPVLKVLEKMGRNLVTKIQDLHQYFMYTIRPSEQILSSFKCTIIYATYLLVGTNYAEFGNSLTKKIQKIKEQNKNQLGELGMQYGIFLRISENYQRLVQNSYELIIENISTDLSVLLKEQKQKLLYKNVTSVIPKEFRDTHSMKFDEYMKNININEHKSSFIGENNNQLPFYAGGGQAIFLNMMAGLRFDPLTNSAVVKCILTKMKNEEINFIVDINGDIIYKQSDQFKEYLQKDIFLQNLENLRNTLESTGHVQRFQTKVIGEQNPISIIFQPLYINQLRQVGQKPLIRIQIKSENLKNQKLKLNNYLITNKVKNIEGKHERKETDSQTSTSSRKQSIENVLSVLMESSSLKMEVFLSITLLLILVCAIISFLVFSNLFLIWNTEVKQNSPTFIVINLIKLKSLINTAISWEYDCLRSQNSPAYMDGLYSMLYNGSSVTAVGVEKFQNILKQQQKIVNNYFFGFESEINQNLHQLLAKTLTMKNPIDEFPQNMSLQNILLNYLVDIYTLSKGQNYNKTLVSFSYMSQLYKELSQIKTQLADNLSKEIVTLRTDNIISISFISVIMVAFIFPIWKFNVSNKKKHQRVFSLLASIQSKLILDQIKKLQKIQQMIFVQSHPQKNTKTMLYNNQKLTSLHQIESQPVSQVKIEQDSQKKPLNMSKVVEGIKKIAAEQLLNTAKDKIPFKVRKRAGQIQIAGSDCDKNRFKFQDWCVAIFLILFLGIIHGIFWEKILYINGVGDHFKISLQQLDKLEDNTNALLNSKIFSDEYTATNQLTFLGEDIQKYLRNWIITYNSYSSFPISQEISVQNCSANILACKNLFSQKIFQGLIKKGISDSYQWTKAALDPASFNNSQHFKNDYVTLEKLRFMLVFSQQLMDLLTNQRFKWSVDSFTFLEQEQKKQNKIKTTFSIIFWILILIFCIFTIFYTISIKKSYIKQVTLLSVLNKQMLYNNKRVESFLHKLSKTS